VTDGLHVTLVEQDGFSFDDKVLEQIFQTGLVEWVDVGPTQYNRGDAIDRNRVQLTIAPWKSFKGKFHLEFNTNKEVSISFYPDSLEAARSLNMAEFASAYAGVHYLCLIRDEVIFSCSQITLPIVNRTLGGPELILGEGRAIIPISQDYNRDKHSLDQLAVVASQLQSGPLPIKFNAAQKSQ